jgi:hypothetical protein
MLFFFTKQDHFMEGNNVCHARIKFNAFYHFFYFFQFGDTSSANLGRLRYDHHLTSELEGDKMVLKITKPPRNKDSFSSLTGQTLSWLLKVRIISILCGV